MWACRQSRPQPPAGGGRAVGGEEEERGVHGAGLIPPPCSSSLTSSLAYGFVLNEKDEATRRGRGGNLWLGLRLWRFGRGVAEEAEGTAARADGVGDEKVERSEGSLTQQISEKSQFSREICRKNILSSK